MIANVTEHLVPHGLRDSKWHFVAPAVRPEPDCFKHGLAGEDRLSSTSTALAIMNFAARSIQSGFDLLILILLYPWVHTVIPPG